MVIVENSKDLVQKNMIGLPNPDIDREHEMYYDEDENVYLGTGERSHRLGHSFSSSGSL